MDIRSWPLDKIMQLPDNLFGQRWVLELHGEVQSDNADVYFFDGTLPDRMVIWEVNGIVELELDEGQNKDSLMRLKMVPQNAVLGTDFHRGDDIFSYTNDVETPERGMHGTVSYRRLRTGVDVQGRKLALRITGSSNADAEFSVGVVISAVPNRIPDGIGRLYE